MIFSPGMKSLAIVSVSLKNSPTPAVAVEDETVALVEAAAGVDLAFLSVVVVLVVDAAADLLSVVVLPVVVVADLEFAAFGSVLAAVALGSVLAAVALGSVLAAGAFGKLFSNISFAIFFFLSSS